jgi:hypothetical protein
METAQLPLSAMRSSSLSPLRGKSDPQAIFARRLDIGDHHSRLTENAS